jgi:hypothetical protein
MGSVNVIGSCALGVLLCAVALLSYLRGKSIEAGNETDSSDFGPGGW